MSMSDVFGENNTSPVYIQRYLATIEILEKNSVNKVIDFGCSDLSFAQRLRNINGLRELCLVDIDKNLLSQCYFKVEPLNYDFLCRRSESLTVSVFCGSIADKDDRLINYEAVTCIELIEHLVDDVLKHVPSTIFGFIKPKIAIFTTPNSEFNQLFDDFKGFRHWDHKFEWNREEFKQWCNSILEKYPEYNVEISGIGKGPTGSEHLGCCTQMAVFTNPNWKAKRDDDAFTKTNIPYELVKQYEYPTKSPLSVEEEIYNCAIYYIHRLSCEEQTDPDELTCWIPLKSVMDFSAVAEVCPNEDKLKNVLIDRGYEVKEIDGTVALKYFIELDDSDLSLENENKECGIEYCENTIEENWDDD